MIVLLRYIGMLNIAVWFGAGVFFTLGVAPAFFTPEMKSLLGEQSFPIFSGKLAMVVVSRYFVLTYWCGCIALLHQMAERFYLGKALQKLNFGLLIGICGLSLLGGLWLQPSLKKLHAIEYGYGRGDLYSPAQKAQAASAFHAWHGVSWAMNLLVLGGVAVYLWRMANPGEGPRFTPTGKFRS